MYFSIFYSNSLQKNKINKLRLMPRHKRTSNVTNNNSRMFKQLLKRNNVHVTMLANNSESRNVVPTLYKTNLKNPEHCSNKPTAVADKPNRNWATLMSTSTKSRHKMHRFQPPRGNWNPSYRLCIPT